MILTWLYPVIHGAISSTHQGHPSGTDPYCLKRFKVLLGKTKLMGPKPPYHALESFHKTVWEASILSAAMEKLNVQDLDCLGRRLETCAFEDLCHELYDEYFDMRIIPEARDKRAQEKEERGREGEEGNMSELGGVIRGRKRKRGMNAETNNIGRNNRRGEAEVEDTALEVSGAAVIERGITDRGEVIEVPESGGLVEGVYIDEKETVDQVRENATLCMQHLALAELFRVAMRDGDSGVVTYMLDVWTLFFHGTNNHKYAAEFLEETINRRLVWKDLYKEIWLNNCLVNITGRKRSWMSWDEACEITVDQIKNDYNPRRSWQSRNFHLNVVSLNINLLRIIKRQVMQSAGASTWGMRKSEVNTMKDIKTLVGLMVQDGIFIRKSGRIGYYIHGVRDGMQGGSREEGTMVRRYQATKDIMELGRVVLRDKALPKALLRRKLKETMLDEDEEMESVQLETLVESDI